MNSFLPIFLLLVEVTLILCTVQVGKIIQLRGAQNEAPTVDRPREFPRRDLERRAWSLTEDSEVDESTLTNTQPIHSFLIDVASASENGLAFSSVHLVFYTTDPTS